MKQILREHNVRVNTVPDHEDAADERIIERGTAFINRDNAAYVVVVSGDSDVSPVFQLARQHGLGSLLVFDNIDRVADTLFDKADLSLDLSSSYLEPYTSVGEQMLQTIQNAEPHMFPRLHDLHNDTADSTIVS